MNWHRFVLVVISVLMIPAAHAEDPALVVVISVDQLRGDLPLMYEERLGEDGFRRFLDRGTAYTNAHYGHTTTYTGSGHATLSTGGNPREHGIIGNDWIDPESGDTVYCVEDQGQKLLGTRTSPHDGTSPRNLLAETIGDVLIASTEGKAKVVSVSRKDRSAILLGGKKGKAFWYDSGSGQFITSDYYYTAYPRWAERWNEAGHADAYGDKVWDLLRPASEYVQTDDRAIEVGYPLFGTTLPYSLKELSERQLYGALSVTPFADELVVSFAKAAVENEQLGLRGVTDMLMVGLSATDSIGHQWGPYSREQEDNLLRVDALLQEFFAYLDERFGRENVLLVLSADHGVDGYPPGVERIGQLNPLDLVNTAKDVLKAEYGDTREYVQRFSVPYIYFTPALREERPEDIAAMESKVAKALRTMDGVAYAIPAHKIAAGELDHENPIMERVYRSYHPKLSGNVLVIQDAYYHIYSGSPRYTATHGTPYSYDTHVPVWFYGPGIAAQRIDRAVGPESLAPTVAALLDIPIPAQATGPVLEDVAGK